MESQRLYSGLSKHLQNLSALRYHPEERQNTQVAKAVNIDESYDQWDFNMYFNYFSLAGNTTSTTTLPAHQDKTFNMPHEDFD